MLVARKELLEIVRDRRSLLVLLLLPVALYPVMFIGSILAATAQLRKMSSQSYLVWVKNLDELPPDLKKRLKEVSPPNQQTRLKLAFDKQL